MPSASHRPATPPLDSPCLVLAFERKINPTEQKKEALFMQLSTLLNIPAIEIKQNFIKNRE